MLLKLFHLFLCSILAIVVLLCVDCCFCPETVSNARTKLVSPQAVMQADPMTILMVESSIRLSLEEAEYANTLDEKRVTKALTLDKTVYIIVLTNCFQDLSLSLASSLG